MTKKNKNKNNTMCLDFIMNMTLEGYGGRWRDMGYGGGGLSSYDVLHDCLLGLKLRLGRKVKVEGKDGIVSVFFFFFFNSLGMVDFKLELMNPKSLKCCQRNSFFKLKRSRRGTHKETVGNV